MKDENPPSSQPLRVAFVSSVLDMGGAITYLANLTRELRQRGVVVQVHGLQHAHPHAVDFESAQVPVLREDERRWIFEDRLQNVLVALRRFAPDVVVAWMGPPAFEVLRYLPAGVRRWGVIHGSQEYLYRDAAQYAQDLDLLITVSQHGARMAAELDALRAVPVRWILPGVVVPDGSVRPRRDGILRVLYSGRLDQVCKRARLLAKVYNDLVQLQVPVRFTILGSGPEETYLRAQMANHEPLQQVNILPPVPNVEVPRILRDHDLLLLVSDSEGTPMCLLEGLCHGLVPVVSDLSGGIRELLDPSVGCLIAPADSGGYARAIQALHQDRERLQQLSAAGMERALARFSITAVTDRWIDILAAPRGPGPVWPVEFSLKPRRIHCRQWDFYQPWRFLRRVAKRGRRSRNGRA